MMVEAEQKLIRSLQRAEESEAKETSNHGGQIDRQEDRRVRFDAGKAEAEELLKCFKGVLEMP